MTASHFSAKSGLPIRNTADVDSKSMQLSTVHAKARAATVPSGGSTGGSAFNVGSEELSLGSRAKNRLQHTVPSKLATPAGQLNTQKNATPRADHEKNVPITNAKHGTGFGSAMPSKPEGLGSPSLPDSSEDGFPTRLCKPGDARAGDLQMGFVVLGVCKSNAPCSKGMGGGSGTMT